MPEQRVLVLAPTGRDATLIGDMLKADSLPCEICRSVAELGNGISTGAALGVLSEEALIGTSLEPLLNVLAEQPAWSDFPLIFLTASGTRATETSTRILHIMGDSANVTILEKPVRVATLISGIRSALRARRRQYQVRDYLEERRRHEEALLQTQKLESLGVLAGGVAHDFNNLLTGILGNASLAMDSLPPGSDEAQSLLEDVVNASQRAAHLTQQLLAYAGKGRFIIEYIDLSGLVRTITHLIRGPASMSAHLSLNLSPDLPPVEGDATQLQQIVMNLVLNAGESIPRNRKGEVFVTTRVQELDSRYIGRYFTPGEVAPGKYVLLEVKDTGEGMDEATLARIFDPFFTTKFTGRGLGLAAVQGIVRSHKGALHVESNPGQGSTFRVFLPAKEPLANVAQEPSEVGPEPGAETGTILVIDDEETVRRTVASTLRHYGYRTVLANGGEEGLRAFEESRGSFSLVLLDLTMPGMGGEEVYRRLRLLDPDVKVLLSSGFNEDEAIQRFTGRGLAGFIRKPYNASALAAKLRSLLQA